MNDGVMRSYSIILIRCIPDFRKARFSKSQGVFIEEAKRIIAPEDEYAVELSVHLKEKFGLFTTALLFARDEDRESIRKSLAMGVDNAYFLGIQSNEFDEIDSYQYASLISLCIKEISKMNRDRKLVAILSGEDTTYKQGQIAQRICEELRELNNNKPLVLVNPILNVLNVNERTLIVATTKEKEKQVQTPAVLVVKAKSNTPRIPSAVNIMRSMKKEITVFDSKCLLAGNEFPQRKVRIVQNMRVKEFES